MIRFTQGRKPHKSFEINFFPFFAFEIALGCLCVCVWLGVSQTSKGFNFQIKKKKEKICRVSFFFLPQFLSFLKKLVGREKMSRVEWSLTEWKEKTNWTLK